MPNRRPKTWSANRLIFRPPMASTPPGGGDPSSIEHAGGFWFRGDTYTGSGTSFVPIEKFFGVNNGVVVGSAGPIPAPSADFNNQIVWPFLAAGAYRVDFGVSTLYTNKNSKYHLVVVAKFRSAPSGTFGVYLTLRTNSAVGNDWFSAWFAANFSGYKNFSVGGGNSFFDVSCGNDTFDYLTPFIFKDRYDGTGNIAAGAKHSVTRNGTPVVFTDSAGAVNTSDPRNCIGAYGVNGLHADIDIAEIIFYPRELTSGEESTIDTYLYTRYQFGPMMAAFVADYVAQRSIFGTWRTGLTTPPQQLRWGKIAAVAGGASALAAAVGAAAYYFL